MARFCSIGSVRLRIARKHTSECLPLLSNTDLKQQNFPVANSVVHNDAMYCPSCGKEIGAGLSFCNQCGTRLAAADPKAISGTSFNLMLAGVVAIPFVGLAMMFVVIAALKNGMGFKDDFIFVITFMTFLLFAIAEIAFVIMLLTRTRGAKQQKMPDGKLQTGQLPAQEHRSLNSPTFEPMPVGSVTDHTTRHLEPSLNRERE